MLKKLESTLRWVSQSNNGFISLECCLWIKGFTSKRSILIKTGFIEETFKDGTNGFLVN
jgi:hypothetical protein